MTKQEIKDLIAAKIAGQGNQVDSGGALAEILNAIADMAGDIPEFEFDKNYSEQEAQKAEFSPVILVDGEKYIMNGFLFANDTIANEAFNAAIAAFPEAREITIKGIWGHTNNLLADGQGISGESIMGVALVYIDNEYKFVDVDLL